MAAWHVLREPTVPILLLASVVHVVRRDLFDLLLFSGTAVVIFVDAGRRPLPVGADRIGRVSPWLLISGMTLFAAVVALAAPASVGARLVLALIGLSGVALVLVRAPQLRGGRADERSAAKGWQVWALIGVAACLWELTSFISQQVWPQSEADHPAVSDLVGPLLLTWFGRVVFLLLWAGSGWWLLRQLIGGGAGHEQGEEGLPQEQHAGEPSEPGQGHVGQSRTRLSTWLDGHSEADR